VTGATLIKTSLAACVIWLGVPQSRCRRVCVENQGDLPSPNRAKASSRNLDEKRSAMKICLSMVHLTTLVFVLVQGATAQTDLPSARIVTLNLDPQSVTVLHLRRGYASSIRLPEEVSTVVLGDPGSFKAEHSVAEPQLVFFKPTTPKAAETNALITTRTGREVALSLVSEGNLTRGGAVDYVLQYEPPRSFLIGAARSSFLVADTQNVARASPPIGNADNQVVKDDGDVLRQQRLDKPHWEGKQLQVAVGRATKTGDGMAVAFSVLNSSPRTIELLPPQIQLGGRSKDKHGRTIKAEQVTVKNYRMTARQLAPGARTDGVVIFERPSFKESKERLLLQVAQVEEVDRPVLAPISFVATTKGEMK
jgi:hypothetical protein